MLQKLAHLDGMKISGSSINSRQIQVTMEVVGSSRSDLESKLDTLDLALSLKQQQLTLHTTPENRYFVADCLSAKTQFANTDPARAMVTLVFLCQAPYAINPTSSTQSIAAGNLALVSGHVYQFANQVFAGGGTAIALPTIHLVNTNGVAWTQVTINEFTDNRTLTITSNLPSSTNDYLDIYCDPSNIPSGGYSVQKNGSTACAFKGVFPVLQPLMTSWNIQVTVSSGAPAGSVQWTWNARYAR
jgi:predicted phage tail component-like protein